MHYQGIILDVDGTLLLHDKALPGAGKAIAALRQADYQIRFVSNTTSRNEAQLAEILTTNNIFAAEQEIQTSVSTCLFYLQSHFCNAKGFIAVPENLQARFDHLPQTSKQPDYVVPGDLDDAFDYALLNQIFNFLRNGAQLVVFHKNPWYFRNGQPWLDSGVFTQALELASGTQAIVTGKPSPVMFRSAVDSMTLEKHQVLVVGDDAMTDITGARNAGLTAVLVGSGKFTHGDLHKQQISRDHFINGIADLPEWLEHKAADL